MTEFTWISRLRKIKQIIFCVNSQSIFNLSQFYKGAGATFDWTLFNNSSWRKVVRRPSKVVMFDSDYVRQLSNIKLIELIQGGDYVRLILISTLIVEHNINWT